MWSRKANCARAAPACRARESPFPASARPTARSPWRSTGYFLLQRRIRAGAARISRIAEERGRRPTIPCGSIPDVDAKTHAKISTGKSENKFGIPISVAREVYPGGETFRHEVAGVDMHIGSQITDLAPFDDAFALLANFVGELRADGHGIHHLDLGGGLGIPYSERENPDSYHPDLYAEVVRRHIKPLGAAPLFEPGRLIVGNAGVLVTAVLYVKRGAAKNFVIVDAAMNDLVRPTLYEAHHEVMPVVRPPDGANTLQPTSLARSAKPAIIWLWTALLARRARRSARHHVGGRLWRGAGGNL